MPYIAHAGILLKNIDHLSKDNVWRTIKEMSGIQYRWKLDKGNVCHVIAGIFDDPQSALRCAKQMYVTLFFKILDSGFGIFDAGCKHYGHHDLFDEDEGADFNAESSFIWNKHNSGGELGPGAYEVDGSFDEFDNRLFIRGSIEFGRRFNICFDDIDKKVFTYNSEAQDYLISIVNAENASNIGIRMTIYCGLLERIASRALEVEYKNSSVVETIDCLLKFVEDSFLSNNDKQDLVNYLKRGKEISSRKKCNLICEKYAEKYYGNISCRDIVKSAYDIRSAYSHGNKSKTGSECATYMKYVVCDVVLAILAEKERKTSE